MNFRNCCIIFNQPREDALADELDVLDQVEVIEKTLRELGIETRRKGITAEFMKEIEELAADKPDFVFNLVESINNKGELGHFIPTLLNLHSIPYSGNPVEAIFITTSKALTSRILKKYGISNPGSWLPSQSDELTSGKRYILKPIWEDGSLGITVDSVFYFNDDYLNKLKKYKDSHWIIEEYIDGREFNVTVLAGDNGPEVMPPAEMTFRNFKEGKPKIVDFKAKWDEESFEYQNTIRCFPGENMNPLLKKRIEETALQCWNVFGLRGYARVDMRVDSNDIPYVIEVNANPCLTPDSGVAAATGYAGLTYKDVVKRIIADINI